MKKMRKKALKNVFRFIVVHSLIVGLFAGMAYFTVELLFFPAFWPVTVF